MVRFAGVTPGPATERAVVQLDRAANLRRPEVRARAQAHVTSGKEHNKSKLGDLLRESDPELSRCLELGGC